MEKILDSLEGKFYDEYFELLINRVTHSTMSLEKDLGDPNDSKNAVRLRDNMKAFKSLLEDISNDGVLTEELVIKTANKINESAWYISDGYCYKGRGKNITGTNIPISSGETVKEDLISLIDSYNNDWEKLDPFEREALFHINFIRIHPFEDGNGRTGRLLLNYNLLKQKIAPVILTEDLNEYYQDYIKENDVEKMANLFKIQSRKEQEVIYDLYNNYEENDKEKETVKKR